MKKIKRLFASLIIMVMMLGVASAGSQTYRGSKGFSTSHSASYSTGLSDSGSSSGTSIGTSVGTSIGSNFSTSERTYNYTYSARVNRTANTYKVSYAFNGAPCNYYKVEVQFNNGSWTKLYKGSSKTYIVTLRPELSSVKFRITYYFKLGNTKKELTSLTTGNTRFI